MIDSLNSSALSGMQNGFDKLQKNAAQIASAGVAEGSDTQSLLAAVVDLRANVTQVSASMKALSVSDELIGTILDIKT